MRSEYVEDASWDELFSQCRLPSLLVLMDAQWTSYHKKLPCPEEWFLQSGLLRISDFLTVLLSSVPRHCQASRHYACLSRQKSFKHLGTDIRPAVSFLLRVKRSDPSCKSGSHLPLFGKVVMADLAKRAGRNLFRGSSMPAHVC